MGPTRHNSINVIQGDSDYYIDRPQETNSFNIGNKTVIIATQMFPLDQLISWLVYITVDSFTVELWDFIGMFEFIITHRTDVQACPRNSFRTYPKNIKMCVLRSKRTLSTRQSKMKKDVGITR